ncbi:MAG: GNAT family N-acetyltransferase [Candidatus Scatosoma sp.]
MNYKMIRLKNEHIKKFKQLAQESFQKGYEDEFGKYEKTILPEKDIDASLNAEGAVSYVVVENGEIIGGAIVNINAKTNRNHLDILFVRVGVQSKGVGMYIWNEIEKLYPDTKIWETYTPYYEKRNIHFYVNKCGFRIVEFFNPKHLAEWNKNGNETGNIPNESGQYFLRFEKVTE